MFPSPYLGAESEGPAPKAWEGEVGVWHDLRGWISL